MPIKKKNFELYPPNWRKISYWIIHVRAQSRCEGCGAENHKPHPETGKMVVLSVAHLDHNPRNSDENLPPDAPLEQSNLRAFCQRCHNRWDREHRNESIKETYEEKHTETPENYSQKVEENIPEEAAAIEELDDIKIYMEAKDDMLLAQAIELQRQLAKVLGMGDKELATPQVQTQLTVLRSRMGVIDQLISLQKKIDNIRGTMAVPAVDQPVTEDVPLDVRGLGIRKYINNKNGKS